MNLDLVAKIHEDLACLRTGKITEDLTKRHVLLIEDSPNDAELLKEEMRPIGVKMDIATSVNEAMSKLDLRQTYRMVLIDLKLGIETAAPVLLRLKSELPLIPVTVVTGIEDPDVLSLIKELGWNVISKPAKLEKIVQAFQRAGG